MKIQNKKTIINYSKNDIFETAKHIVNAKDFGCNIIIPHVCNNINAFGAGFAAAINNRYPIVKDNYHMLGKSQKLGNVQYVSVYKEKTYGHELIIANMIAQNGIKNFTNKRPLNYLALCYCMNNIASYIKQNTDKDTNAKYEIHCPKFGSGLAGGNWEFIKDLISDTWNNINVTVYSYSPQRHNVKSN